MTQAGIIRFLILGLPVGLIAGGIIAMKVYYREQRTPSTVFGHARKEVNRADIQSHVEMLAKTIGSRSSATPDRIKFAVKYIESTLSPANMGFLVSRQTYKTGGVENHNLVVEIPGTHPDHLAEVVLVGANYDSAPESPGADTNASGVAACLSLCQAFATTRHERAMRFVFFANGEAAETGAAEYAQDCKQRGEKIVAALSLNSLGFYTTAKNSQKSPPGVEPPFPDTGDFLAAVGHAPGRSIVETLQSSFAKYSTLAVAGRILPDLAAGSLPGGDDPFAQQGYPAVVLTDTAAVRNPHFHLASDTPDTLDYERLTQAVRGIEGVLQILANPARSADEKR